MKIVKIIGRSSNCEIVINDPHVSREHLQIIKHENGDISIFDLESTTGTYVNGKKIAGEIKLKQHDIVKIGNTLLKWKSFFKTEPKTVVHIKNNTDIENLSKKDISKNIHENNKDKPFIEREQYLSKKNNFKISGFGKRLAAFLLDSLFLSVIVILLLFGLAYISNFFLMTKEEFELFFTILAGVTSWLYFAISESSFKQATFGKQILKIQITQTDGKSKISFMNATGRYLSKNISSLIIMIGWLMPLWTEKKQALHDIIANTLVIEKNKI